MEGLFTSKGSKLPSAPASHYNSQHSSSRISMDQVTAAVLLAGSRATSCCKVVQ